MEPYLRAMPYSPLLKALFPITRLSFPLISNPVELLSFALLPVSILWSTKINTKPEAPPIAVLFLKWTVEEWAALKPVEQPSG